MGSAESEEYDQVLDSVLVGPVPAGRHMFVFQVSGWGYKSRQALGLKESNALLLLFCHFTFLAATLILASPCFTLGSHFSRAPSQADAPNTGLIPESDAVGVTVVLITCTYRGQEFIRIGYYVNNEYTDPELRENPPLKPDYTQVLHTLTEQHC